MQFAISAAAAFALFTSANAHLFISSPTPMKSNAIKNPLDPSGSDFPCHGAPLGQVDGTVMKAGSQQNLVFDSGENGDNWAVHGGGSCQISITYETDPVKVKDPNNWRVLYSIEGGCPTNSPLNLNGNYVGPNGPYTFAWQCSDPKTNGYDCVNSFEFTIPSAVKNGRATLAWTWFNNVGNREMYMNCVNVNFQGGKSDDSGLGQFPAMFVANLASVNPTCKTTEQQNVGFPNPGANVQKKVASPNMRVASAKDYPIVTPSGCPAGAYNPPAPTAGGSSSAPAPSAPAPSAPATTNAPAPVPTPTGAAPAPPKSSTTKQAGKPQTTIKKRPVATQPAAPSRVVAPTGTTAVALPVPSANQGSCANGSVPCTGVNSIVCVDLNHFGICDYNGCAISQAVAPGTECSSGSITWARKSKRHLSRHIRNAHKF